MLNAVAVHAQKKLMCSHFINKNYIKRAYLMAWNIIIEITFCISVDFFSFFSQKIVSINRGMELQFLVFHSLSNTVENASFSHLFIALLI